MRSRSVPPLRLVNANSAPVRGSGAYVLYWMIASRRLRSNFALVRAVEWARHLNRSLLIFEPLRARYPWASVRLHRFCLDGMAEHRKQLESTRVGYYPYVEPEDGAGKGLLGALAEKAAVVITDDFPGSFLPRMVQAAAEELPVAMETVDSNGLVPLRAPDRDFATAHSFRRYLQRDLPTQLESFPAPNPLRGNPLPPFEGVAPEVKARWRPRSPSLLEGTGSGGWSRGLDQGVREAPSRGGAREGGARLEHFLHRGLARYGEDRNHPDREGSSGLSPYLHWGHVGAHEVVHAILDAEDWHPGRLRELRDGSRSGWWGLPEGVEAFLDQLVTWRELGYNTAHRLGEAAEAFESLPGWALRTLEEHRSDPRAHVYTAEAFEAARTHDPLWNAAQRELRQRGSIHGYLRMLWGKGILEWSSSPEEALEIMVHLNNRWALDGRDPNSTAGIFWVLGRYDRGWPSRPVFGTVRSMTSRSTRKKVEVARYLERFGSPEV